MPALSFWDVAAKRPSCLMAVTPYRGGTWASMLKSGVAMPSATPRNFATEPATWYQAVNVCKQISDAGHDWRIELAVTISGSGAKTVWRTSLGDTYSPFVMIWVDSNNIFWVRVYDKNELVINSKAAGTGNGIYRIVATKIGTNYVLQTWKDGTQTQSVTVTATTTTTSYTYGAPTTQAGTNLRVTLTDLTTGKVEFAYPTWAEEKRLLTLDNIDTSDGTFRAADISKKWGATTQLDLRGRPARLTMIARCYIPPLLTSGTLDVYNLIAQGSAQSFVNAVCNFGIYVYQTELTLLGGFVASPVNAYHVSGSNADAEHVITCVIDYDARQSRMYLDGVMLSQRNNPAMPSTFPTSAVYPAVTLQNSTYSNESGTYPLQIHHAQVHDYAMTAAEIAQFK